MKELYHGTIAQFDVIDVNACKGYKDFGKGFYATAVVSHAEKLAIRNKGIAERRQAFIKARCYQCTTVHEIAGEEFILLRLILCAVFVVAMRGKPEHSEPSLVFIVAANKLIVKNLAHYL